MECHVHFVFVFIFSLPLSRSTMTSVDMFLLVVIPLVLPCSSLEGKSLIINQKAAFYIRSEQERYRKGQKVPVDKTRQDPIRCSVRARYPENKQYVQCLKSCVMDIWNTPSSCELIKIRSVTSVSFTVPPQVCCMHRTKFMLPPCFTTPPQSVCLSSAVCQCYFKLLQWQRITVEFFLYSGKQNFLPTSSVCIIATCKQVASIDHLLWLNMKGHISALIYCGTCVFSDINPDLLIVSSCRWGRCEKWMFMWRIILQRWGPMLWPGVLQLSRGDKRDIGRS